MEYICKNKDKEANIDIVWFSDYNSAYAYDSSSVRAEERLTGRDWSDEDLVSWHKNLCQEVKTLTEKMGIICADDRSLYDDLSDKMNSFGYIPTDKERIELVVRGAAFALSRGRIDHSQAAINGARILLGTYQDGIESIFAE
jgi:hypothetical protein